MTMEISDRLIVALDVPTVAEARVVVKRLEGVVSFYKIGPWLIYALGFQEFVDELVRNHYRVFIDAKMKDVPRTVHAGIRSISDMGVDFVTVDGTDAAVMEAASLGADDNTKVLAVPMLTTKETSDNAMWHYAKKARECGCHGIIASGLDTPFNLKTASGTPDFLVVTPGVRLEGDDPNGHVRYSTPYEAMKRGADYIVVGRPIVAAPKPLIAAVKFIVDMERGHADSAEG